MATQVIKYQDTKVEVEKTVSELAALIKRYGGSRFEQAWTPSGGVEGVRFAIRHETLGELPVNLTAKTAQIRRIMEEAGLWKTYPKAEREEKLETQAQRIQAQRIAWRHLKDLTEQLLLAVSLGLKTLPEAFLADVEMLDQATGETLRMGEFLERHASLGPGGLEIDAANSSGSGAIPLPAAGG